MDECEADARSFLGASAGVGDAVKALEHPWQFLRRDADAGVADDQLDELSDLLLADDFLEFGSSGTAYDKRRIIAALLADPENNRPRYATMQAVKLNWLADGVALLTYRSTKTNPRAVRANRCSIWKRIDGRWRMVFHQGTPVG